MLESFEEKLDQANGIETEFVKILTYYLKPGYSGMYKSQSYTRFCTIVEGSKNLIIDNQSFTYTPSQSLLLPPYSEVYMDIHVPTKALVLEVSNELIEHVNKKSGNSANAVQQVNPKELLLNNLQTNISSTVFELTKSVKHKEPFIIDLYAQQLIYQFIKNPKTSGPFAIQVSNPMDKAIQYMKQHISQPFSSHDLAALMNMSTSNFSHSFKQYTGTSPIKYMQALKMIHSKELLHRMTVTETAFELGFESPSYFIHVFKKSFGYTPKKYQQGL